MVSEQIANILTILIVAMFISLGVLRMHRSDTRRSAELLRRMKAEFFPQLEANLSEVRGKLDASGGGEYASLLAKGLSATLNIEFRLRFYKEVGKLDRLRDDLVEYEKDVAKAATNRADFKLAERVRAHNTELGRRVDELNADIRGASKRESLPEKVPSVG